MPPDFLSMARRFTAPSITALALFGSHARGDAGPYSDIDIVRFRSTERSPDVQDGSYWLDTHLVNVSTVSPAEAEQWFSEPQLAVTNIVGVRVALPLIDPVGTFAAIRQRARDFRWTEALQTKANLWASRQMAGWAEEAHKGLEGVRRNDVGRLLNSRHGGSWGMSRVMAVQRGILLSGDNAMYDEVAEGMKDVSEWAPLRRSAFGIEDETGHTPSLVEQVRAGLQLYVRTAELLAEILQPADRPIIENTVARIRAELSNY